jgi:hypothetical protein
MRFLFFTATTEGPNRLLCDLFQRYADEQWVAVHMTPEQATESVLDCFKHAVRQELETLELECSAAKPNGAAPTETD